MGTSEILTDALEKTKELAQTVAAGVQQAAEFVCETVAPAVCRITVKVLNRLNIWRLIRQAMEQANIARAEDTLKAVIQEMASNGEFTVVSMNVLEGLDDEPICTVEVTCEQVEDGIMPGEVIYDLEY